MSREAERMATERKAKEAEYIPHSIEAWRHTNGKALVLTRWKGYGNRSNTWEPLETFQSQVAFLAQYNLPDPSNVEEDVIVCFTQKGKRVKKTMKWDQKSQRAVSGQSRSTSRGRSGSRGRSASRSRSASRGRGRRPACTNKRAEDEESEMERYIQRQELREVSE